jgi:hypothetical protein
LVQVRDQTNKWFAQWHLEPSNASEKGKASFGALPGRIRLALVHAPDSSEEEEEAYT